MRANPILEKEYLVAEEKKEQRRKRVERRKKENHRLQEEELKLQETEKKLKEEQELRRREREEKKKQEEEQRQGMMMEQTTPIQVDESEKPPTKEEGEQMKDWEIYQQIEKMIEVTDMWLEKEPQNEDTDLMQRAPKVISQSLPPPVSEPVPIE